MTLAYSFRNGFPFSTYGENFFLTVQNTLITLLIIYYAGGSRSNNTSTKLTIALTGTLASAFALYSLPKETLSLLQFSTLPLSLFSKLPQIRQNARSRSTGQISAFAVISQIAGCLARLFTTATEVGDLLVSAGFALALALNCVLGFQLWTYWGKNGDPDDVPLSVLEEKRAANSARSVHPPEEKREAPWVQPAHNANRIDVVTPPRSPAPSGRKWARKVD